MPVGSRAGEGGRPSSLVPPLVVALLAIHLAFSVAPSLVSIRSDFVNYYVTARARFEGRRLDRAYERAWLETERARAGIPTLGFFIPNPPANALLLLPVAGLGPQGAKAAWSALLALCLLLSFLTLRRVVALSPWLLALVFLIPSASVRNALLYAPPYPLLLLFMCLSLAALLGGRDYTSGLLLAPAVALKLYGLAFFPYFLLARRFRAALGLLTGVVVLTSLSLAVLGAPLHSVYLREMLGPSLTGRILDPYSPNWQSLASLSRRLFESEPELNPNPLTHQPHFAECLAAGLPAGLMFLALICTRRETGADSIKRDWAILTVASLAASSMPATYHFVLLALPVALLLDQEQEGGVSRWRPWLILAVHGFCTSPLPHFFAPLAAGWGNILAVPRLLGLLILLAWALHPASAARLLSALAVGALVALSVRHPGAQRWRRVEEAHGLISAEPVACGGELAWVTVSGESYVVRTTAGQSFPGASPRCLADRLYTSDAAFLAALRAVPEAPLAEAMSLSDLDVAAGSGERLVVFVDTRGLLRERGSRGERILASGPIRHPRLAPGWTWIVFQSFENGSWNIEALERPTGRRLRLTEDPANEVEPSWSRTGDQVYFASDRRRGLGGTALYTLPFAGTAQGGAVNSVSRAKPESGVRADKAQGFVR